MNLSGNTILITGGSSGIGLEMTKAFLDRNNTVIVKGRNSEKLKKAKKELDRLITIQSDAGNPDDVKKLFTQVKKEFPQLNILINNAGTMQSINLQDHDLTSSELTMELDVNLKGVIWMNDAFFHF